MDFRHRSSEPFVLIRDCAALTVPAGKPVTMRVGCLAYITQALGGSFTIYVDGNLFRIAGEDADALGKSPPEPLTLPEHAGTGEVEDLVRRQLETCFDPEIPVNILDLGLVYELELRPLANGEHDVHIVMTLTAPGCGMGAILADDVRCKAMRVPKVAAVDVRITFDPPWSLDMMSEAARLETGLL
ncbi:putative Fe-S cluster assembly protein SufT [Oleiagrimonas sp. MCCC 1A03011]|uniref:putative Fe-S cluster assembly protein SufT n=1 Tax=Oleiagrimonas sp. MCCC 1A03011 TaxID=1926883 RepID=UPI000DC22362|nr:putative Fe-S cluster assembly protein SufT [Oleiagrimonas sp. MCCC 1A03011]RAP55697.1 putative Fe-S cluster assembly protein SufT [Oleiagrimonas sp. MCCC 1A03011]